MVGSIKHFYAGGNTARGFVSLFESSLEGLDRVYILKGGPGTGKSTLIRTIGGELAERGYDIWFIHCASDNDSLDGVIVPALKLGIVDGAAPHVIEPKLPGAVEQIVNLGQAWDAGQLIARKAEIAELTARIGRTYVSAYACFADALRIHDEWEKVYIDHMDFDRADRLVQELAERLFAGRRLDKRAAVRHRYLGAATPKGAVDFVPNLTEDVSKRYFIKGRPGSGKSTMLKKLAAEAEERGFDVEMYHCGFDPNSLDMIILRELGVALFDSTAPHEYFPERDGDEIVDMYALCIEPGTDERYEQALHGIRARYTAAMKSAIGHLAAGRTLREPLKSIYAQTMDFAAVDRMRDSIRTEIDAWIDRVSKQ